MIQYSHVNFNYETQLVRERKEYLQCFTQEELIDNFPLVIGQPMPVKRSLTKTPSQCLSVFNTVSSADDEDEDDDHENTLQIVEVDNSEQIVNLDKELNKQKQAIRDKKLTHEKMKNIVYMDKIDQSLNVGFTVEDLPLYEHLAQRYAYASSSALLPSVLLPSYAGLAIENFESFVSNKKNINTIFNEFAFDFGVPDYVKNLTSKPFKCEFPQCFRCFAYESDKKIHEENVHKQKFPSIPIEDERAKNFADHFIQIIQNKPISKETFQCLYANIDGVSAKYEFLIKCILGWKVVIDVIALTETKEPKYRGHVQIPGYSLVCSFCFCKQSRNTTSYSSGIAIYTLNMDNDSK